MAGINQGTPEAAIGEPIRLGSNEEFEIEQHPVSDRLIIRDTVNGKVAYVRKERGGQIGGDGVLIKALKEGKPMADDGRTYDTIQQAERAATSWVFLPPTTYNENVEITTESLTLRGSGYNTNIVGVDANDVIQVVADDVTLSNFRAQHTGTTGDITAIINGPSADRLTMEGLSIENPSWRAVSNLGFGATIMNCTFLNGTSDQIAVVFNSSDGIFVGNKLIDNGADAMTVNDPDCIIANNHIINSGDNAINTFGGSDNTIFLGNVIQNSGADGIRINSSNSNCIVANNRISDTTGVAINDYGTGTLLDSNLTGASN